MYEKEEKTVFKTRRPSPGLDGWCILALIEQLNAPKYPVEEFIY